MIKYSWIPAFSLIAALSGQTMFAQNDNTGTNAGPTGATGAAVETPIARMDKIEAINRLHHINQKEIRLSQLALARSQNEAVRSFAQSLIDEHRANEEMLFALVDQEEDQDQRDVPVRLFRSATDESLARDQLSALPRADFDLVFVHLMNIGHQMAVNDLQLLQANVLDAEVKGLLTQTLPVIQEHQQESAALEATLAQGSGVPQPTASPQPSPTPSPAATTQPTGATGATGGTTGATGGTGGTSGNGGGGNSGSGG